MTKFEDRSNYMLRNAQFGSIVFQVARQSPNRESSEAQMD